jgi:hypothetical protein
VRLRIKEHFRMSDPISCSRGKILPSQGLEILFLSHNIQTAVIIGQKVVEVGEMLVPFIEGFCGGVVRGGGQGDVVFGGEGEKEGRGETAFKVEVVFAFWEGGEEGVEGGFAHFGRFLVGGDRRDEKYAGRLVAKKGFRGFVTLQIWKRTIY